MSDITLRYLLFGEDRSASRAVHGVGDAAESTTSRIGGAFSKMSGAVGGEVGDLLNRLGEGLGAVGEKAGTAGESLTAAGGAITGIGAAFQMVGSSDKQASDQLKAAIDATGGSVSDYSEEIEKSIKHMENYGRSAADTQNALATLTEATHDPKKALENMGLVADLAAARHTSLKDAADQLARGLAGQTRVFTQYGVTLQKNKDGTRDVDGAVKQLAERLHGQAAASVDNFRGKIEVVKTKLEDWAAVVGQKLGPVMTAIGPTLMAVGAAMELIRAKQEAAAAATVAETAATEAQSIATRGVAAAQAVLNAVMDANPILLVVTAIAALAAGFAAAWESSKTFRDIVTGAVRDVTDVFKGILDFFENNWPTLKDLIIGPPGMAIEWLVNHWDDFVKFLTGIPQDIGNALSGAWDFLAREVSGVLGAVSKAFSDFVSFVASIPDKVFHDVSGMWDFISRQVGHVFDDVGHAFDDGVDFVKRVPGRIETAASGMFDFVGREAHAVGHDVAAAFDDMVSFLHGLSGRVGGAVAHVWDEFVSGFKDAINTVIGFWDDFASHLNIPSFNIGIPHTPINYHFGGLDIGGPLHIAKLAEGGIVNRPTYALVGEAGPEAVIPLSRAHSFAAAQQPVININVTGAMDPDAVARQIDQLLRRLHRNTGGNLGYGAA